MWNEGVGVYTRYIRRADGGAVAPDPVPDPSMGMPYYQTTEDMLPLLIDQGKEAERYGSIKPPESPTMAYAAEGFRGIERALEGNPAQFFLPGGGIANVVERKAYGEEPSAMDYGMAALDVADVTPVGKAIGALKPLAAILVGPAARGASNIRRRVDKLVERGLEGQDLWDAQANQSKRGYYDPSDGKFRMEIDTSGAKINPEFLDKNFSDNKYFALDYNKTYLDDATLGQVLDFKELFDQYPQLRDIKVTKFDPWSVNITTSGAYDPVNKILYMNSQSSDNFLSTMLHEVQHAVQAEERFLRGGNARMLYRPGFVEESTQARNNLDLLAADLTQLMSKYASASKRGSREPLSPKVVDNMAAAYKAYGNNFDKALDLHSQMKSPDKEIRLEAYRALKDLPGNSFEVQISMDQLLKEFDSPEMIRKALSDTGPLFNTYLEVGEEYADLLKEADEYHQRYMKIPGEVESRNVEKRHQQPHLSDIYPPDTAAVRPEDMIYPLTPAYRREYLRMKDFGPELPNPPIEQKAAGGGVGSLSHIARAM